MFIIRKELTPNELQVPTTRYDASCDCVQVTSDGGVTWNDALGMDPRSQTGYLLPLRTGDDPRCDTAANMVDVIKNFVITMDNASTAWAIASLLLALFGAFLPLGLIVALVVIVADAIWTIGIATLKAAMTDTVYDQLLCIIYCRLGADGELTEENFAGLYDDISITIEETAAGFLYRILDLVGRVGLSNMGASGVLIGDCADCGCGWCYKFDFTTCPYNPNIVYVAGGCASGYGASTITGGLLFRNDYIIGEAISHVEITVVNNSGAPGSPFMAWGWYDGTYHALHQWDYVGSGVYTWDNPDSTVRAKWYINLATGSTYSMSVSQVVLSSSTGTNPYGADNC